MEMNGIRMSYIECDHTDAVVLEPARPACASVLWLHGLGADGRDFLPLVPQLHLPNRWPIRFVFPHAPIRPVTINNGMAMRAWYDLRGLAPGDEEDLGGITASADLLATLIRRERDAGIAARRLFIAGFSQGGALALYAALRYTEPLGGVLALSTYLPLRDRLASEASDANRQTPILMCHGRYDPVVPLRWAELSRDALLAQGYPLEWKEYLMQHEVGRQEIDAISAWLQARLAD